MGDSNFAYFSKVLVSGACGGSLLTLTGHPLDTIKVNIQTMKQVNGKMPFNNAFDCAKKIVAKNGIRGLYAGLGPPLTFISIIFSCRFFGFQLGKRLQQKDKDDKLDLEQLFRAGLLAGFLQGVVTAPVERIKCLLQSQNNTSNKQFYGPIHCLRELYKENGLRSLYRGYAVTLARDCPNLAIYYVTYEVTSQKVNRFVQRKNGDSSNLKPFITLFSGAIAGWSYWILGIPIDVVKSRLQSTVSLATYERGARSVLRELIQKDGIRSLYRGITPVVIRAPIANSFCFLGYESAMSLLNYLF